MGEPVDRFLAELHLELDAAWEKYHEAGTDYLSRQVWDMRVDALDKTIDLVCQVSDDLGV
jgi:uncharacterized protein (DUF736 family)